MITSSNGNIFRVTGHLCGNSPVPGEFPTQRPVTRSFDVFFDLRLNKRLSKQSWGWWSETLSRSLWRHRNVSRWDKRIDWGGDQSACLIVNSGSSRKQHPTIPNLDGNGIEMMIEFKSIDDAWIMWIIYDTNSRMLGFKWFKNIYLTKKIRASWWYTLAISFFTRPKPISHNIHWDKHCGHCVLFGQLVIQGGQSMLHSINALTIVIFATSGDPYYIMLLP